MGPSEKLSKSFRIVKNGKLVPASTSEWSEWFRNPQSEGRIVGNDHVGGIRVSTVCLGMNHGLGNEGCLWFETMIFGAEMYNDYQERYETLEQAKEGHLKAVAMVKGSCEE